MNASSRILNSGLFYFALRAENRLHALQLLKYRYEYKPSFLHGLKWSYGLITGLMVPSLLLPWSLRRSFEIFIAWGCSALAHLKVPTSYWGALDPRLSEKGPHFMYVRKYITLYLQRDKHVHAYIASSVLLLNYAECEVSTHGPSSCSDNFQSLVPVRSILARG